MCSSDLISFLWFLYRKMYLHAFVYAIGPMASTYITGDMTVGVVWSVMAGATANYLYYWHCKEELAGIKEAGKRNPAAQEAALKEAGGVQPYVIYVGIALYVIALAGLAKMIEEGQLDKDTTPPRLSRPTFTGSTSHTPTMSTVAPLFTASAMAQRSASTLASDSSMPTTMRPEVLSVGMGFSLGVQAQVAGAAGQRFSLARTANTAASVRRDMPSFMRIDDT